MPEPLPSLWTSAEVRRRVEAEYPESQRAAVLRELAKIIHDPESLQARVQLAVLTRARGSLEKLRESVSAAIEDFRGTISDAYGG